MPSSWITADEAGQAYWVPNSRSHCSVGSSGGIFRGQVASAPTVPDSLGAFPLLLFSVIAFAHRD